MGQYGISVYPDIKPLDEIIEYFKLAASYGCKRVFSSMFSVEGTKEEVLDYFDKLIKEAHNVGLEVSLDVNPMTFELVGASESDIKVFKDLDVDVLRMDLSFGVEKDLGLINNPYGILIEFNASIVDPSHIRKLIEKGADKDKILVCHNFYPQRYTGMKWDKFRRMNKQFKECGVKVGAFVSSNAEDTHGVWDAIYGLPTVEMMRDFPIDLQVRLLLASEDVDDVLIGNAFASKKEFESLKSVFENIDYTTLESPMIKTMIEMGFLKKDMLVKKIRVRLHPDAADIEKEILFNFFPHVDIGDSSEWMWRSRLPRMVYQESAINPRVCSKEYFDVGDIVIVNDSYKHYAGEIQIVLEPMKNDGQRNFIGYLNPNELHMLDLIKDYDIVVFSER